MVSIRYEIHTLCVMKFRFRYGHFEPFKIKPTQVIPYKENIKSAQEELRFGAFGFPDRSDEDDGTPDSDVQGHSERTGRSIELESK